MIRSDDEYGNAVDFFLEWEKQIREKAIDDFVRACYKKCKTMYRQRYIDMRNIEEIAEQLKERDMYGNW